MLALILPFLTALFTAAPELIKEVEKLIADVKNGAPPAGPITPQVVADMAALDAKMKALAAK